MMVGRFFLVLAGACQFGNGVGGFANEFIHAIHSFIMLAHSHNAQRAWSVAAANRKAIGRMAEGR